LALIVGKGNDDVVEGRVDVGLAQGLHNDFLLLFDVLRHRRNV
jgi:hypothetical protein